MSNRNTGLDLTAVTLFGTDYVAATQSISVEVQNKSAEGKGATDKPDYPVVVGNGVTISCDIMIPASGSATLMGTAIGATPYGAFSVNTGSGTYAGTAMIETCRHSVEREGIQTVSVTLKSQGGVTLT